MRKILLCLLMGFMALSINEIKAEVYGSISGRVIDQATQKGVENVYIFIGGNRIKSITDKNGNYVFKLMPPGNYELTLDLQFLSGDLMERYDLKHTKKLQVSLKSGTNVIDANFNLEKIGSISGKIYFLDGETPIIGGAIYAFNTTDAFSEGYFLKETTNYNTTDNMMKDFKILKVANNSNWQLLFLDRIKGKTNAYIYDGVVEVTNGNDVKSINFVLRPYANTKIYGQLKDNYGKDMNNMSGDVYFSSERAELSYKCNIDLQGKYLIQGDILPGGYEVAVVINEFFPNKHAIQTIYKYNNGKTIINYNEQKELNINFDSAKAEIVYRGM